VTYTAKDIVLRPISRRDADACVEEWHYSGKPYPKAQIHIGAFLGGRLEGCLQYGDPVDRRRVLGLVEGTQWHHMTELNRMAFSDRLPRNSESRALAVSFRLLRKHAPQVKWVLSYADATQCGDGAIYRASGFLLTGIRENSTLYELPDGRVVSDIGVRSSPKLRRELGLGSGSAIPDEAKALQGYQIRYVKFLDEGWRDRLTVDAMDYDRIDEVGAGMYKGEKKG